MSYIKKLLSFVIIVVIVSSIITALFGPAYIFGHMVFTVFLSLILAVSIILGLMCVFKHILEDAGVLGSEWQGIICESDWYPSLSRIQFLTWTTVVGIVFVWILLLKVLYSYVNNITISTDTLGIPNNLLLLMGMSSFTTVASKGLSSVKYKGTKAKPKETRNLWTMFLENDRPSLTRYQIFLWTSISVFAYLVLVLVTVTKNYNNISDVNLPDCPELLLALMGVSQVTYLSGKFTFQPPEASISEIVCDSVKKVTIFGLNFGDKKGSVLFNETVVDGEAIDLWENSKIKLVIPDSVNMSECKVRVVNVSGSMTYPYEYQINTENTSNTNLDNINSSNVNSGVTPTGN